MLHQYLDQFPAVLLLGARQVGKTTLLAHEIPGWTHVDLEDASAASLVSADPALFLRDHPRQVWFDEAHRSPELFSALRVAIDRDRRPGRFVLSGSAGPALAARVSESLAGRAGLLHLRPFSVAESTGADPSPFLGRLIKCPDASAAVDLVADRGPLGDPQVTSAWFAGGFPEPFLLGEQVRRRRWYDSYLRLVSERDLGELHRDLRPGAVRRLLRMLAARHGQALNVSALATDFGVSNQKVRLFLDLLEGALLWRRQEAWSKSIRKRISKTPRGWIVDAGLLHALLDLRGLGDLEVHSLKGASFEGWVLQDLAAQADLLDDHPRFYYWRTHAGAEVDLVIEHGDRLIPVEIKHGANVGRNDLRGLLSFMESFGPRVPFALVIYRGEQAARPNKKVCALPLSRVL